MSHPPNLRDMGQSSFIPHERSQPVSLPSRFSRITDHLIESLVIPSFTKLGPMTRQRLERWDDPAGYDGGVIVVTGASSGLGAAAGVALAQRGARLHLIGRDRTRTEAVASSIRDLGGEVATSLVDLADLAAVAALGAELEDRYQEILGLVHNAGALSRGYVETPSGHELTVVSQLFGPQVLTAAMGALLWRSPRARIILMSSGGMYTQRFDLSTLEMTAATYDGVVAYARVKRAQVLLAQAWAAHFAPNGPVCCSMHPGWVATPGVSESLPGFARVLGPLLRSPGQGVDTLLWLLAPSTHIEGGAFYFDRHPRSTERWPWRHASGPQDPATLLDFVESVTGAHLPARS